MNRTRYLELLRKGVPNPERGALLFKSGDAPDPPDYNQAARTQGQASAQAAIINSMMNRANQFSPFGSQTWERSGTYQVPAIGQMPGFSIPTFTGRTQLTREGQQLFDQNLQAQLGIGGQLNSAVDRTKATLNQPLLGEQDLMTRRDQVADSMMGQARRQLDPYWAQRDESERTRLANAGFSIGNEGYDNAMDDFYRRREGAYQDASFRSMMAGRDEMDAMLRQQSAMRAQPISELNALRTGAMPGMPTFGGTPSGSNVTPGNFQDAANATYGAEMDGYNADVQSSNQTMQGIGTIASIAAMFF